MDTYYATYAIAKPTSKEEAGRLLGADNIIGDVYKVVTKIKGGSHEAKVVNRFGNTPAVFDADVSRQLALNDAKGFKTYAVLTCVGFTQTEGDGDYWAEFAVVSFPESELETFSVYVDEVSQAVKNNKRPEVDLAADEVQQIIENRGHFISNTTHPKLEKKKGQVILKSQVKLSDKLVEQGRKKNPGCYIFGWLFLLAFIALIVMVIMKVIG